MAPSPPGSRPVCTPRNTRRNSLSPNEQNVLGGLVKDLPSTVQSKIESLYEIVPFCIVPLFGTYYYAKSSVEKEKIAHRY